MTFIPNSTVASEMLEAVGLSSVADLFADVPSAVRAKSWNLPPGRSEMEVVQYLRQALSKNRPTTQTPSFVGGTLKEHFVPSFVPRIMFRQEFYTSYTPYQAELAQGTLQALFEYQSLLGEITEMPVVNGSMYDYSTALAEAGLMLYRVTGRKKILVPRALHPERRSTLQNYVKGHGIELVEYGHDASTGQADRADAESKLGPDVAGLVIESPNLFGVLEDVAPLAEAAHRAGALLVQGFDLTSLGLVAPPGQNGADIAVADGTTLVFPPGGPELGIFACRDELVRSMPGRLIGATRDRKGQRAYCMTLQTREQHIRRERATSNICTNEALLAIGLGAHLAALGPKGLTELAQLNFERAHQLRDRLQTEVGWKPLFSGPAYNEFTVSTPQSAEALYESVGSKGITPGWPLSRALPDQPNALVVCSTEVHSDQDHASFVRLLKEVAP
jgi:glycine cleavage system P protein (glycine dehydrogenase) subunit 1